MHYRVCAMPPLRRDTIRDYIDPLELELLRDIKQALDPDGWWMPGMVL